MCTHSLQSAYVSHSLYRQCTNHWHRGEQGVQPFPAGVSSSDSSQQLLLKTGEKGTFPAKPLSWACSQIHLKHTTRIGEHSPALQNKVGQYDLAVFPDMFMLANYCREDISNTHPSETLPYVCYTLT